jgi:hypothetical protein
LLDVVMIGGEVRTGHVASRPAGPPPAGAATATLEVILPIVNVQD